MADQDQSQLEEAERKLQDTRSMLEQKNIERSELQGNLEVKTKTLTYRFFNFRFQHARRRLENVLDKRERAQRNAEDKQAASKNTISRLQKDFEEMSVERRDNDKQVEETKKQIEEVERKVSGRELTYLCFDNSFFQMAEHLWKNEGEMNELYGQYMRLRHHMGNFATSWIQRVRLILFSDLYMETLANKMGVDLEAAAAAA